MIHTPTHPLQDRIVFGMQSLVYRLRLDIRQYQVASVRGQRMKPCNSNVSYYHLVPNKKLGNDGKYFGKGIAEIVVVVAEYSPSRTAV